MGKLTMVVSLSNDENTDLSFEWYKKKLPCLSNEEVFGKLMEDVVIMLDRGDDVTLHTNYLTRSQRNKVLDLVPDNYEVNCVVKAVKSTCTALKRIFQMPTEEEGFSNIEVVYPNDDGDSENLLKYLGERELAIDEKIIDDLVEDYAEFASFPTLYIAAQLAGNCCAYDALFFSMEGINKPAVSSILSNI